MIVEAKSSFLGVPKDIAYIMRKIIGNKNIARLLYHTDPRCLDRTVFPNEISNEQIAEMLKNKQISTIPRVKVDEDKKTYLIVGFNNYIPNDTNSFYRDHSIEIRIITHFDTWLLQDNDIRVYRIAGEVDSMLDGAKLSGIGITNFISATQDVYDEDYGGLTLNYRVVRGTEDKKEDIRPMI